MAETLGLQPTAEQRVFGDTFTLKDGESSIEEMLAYKAERRAARTGGATVWMAGTLVSDKRVVAYLYKGEDPVTHLHVEYDNLQKDTFEQLATSTAFDADGELTLPLAEDVLFDDAVVAAEQYAASLDSQS